ncbi:MAG: DUF3713 domain-containing protein [Mycoplasmoidaceae bacterium]
MKKSKSKFVRLSLITLGLVAIVSPSVLLLASCSGADQKKDKDRVDRGDGTLFAKNEKNPAISTTLEEGLYEALTNEGSMTKSLDGHISNLFYNTIKFISEELVNESGDKGNATFSRDLKNKEEEIDKDYKKLVENEQKNSSDWERNLQDNYLDPNGGTEESYKNIKRNEWALTYLTDKIFEESFIFTAKNGAVIKTPQVSDLMKALNKIDGYSFIWKGENKLENFYAAIQEFVFEEWLMNEKPMIVNMSLWKYGTPKGGINSIFNTNIKVTEPEPEEQAMKNIDSRQTDLAGTYEFPYFSSSADNSNFSSIEKFNNFVTTSKATPNHKLSSISGVPNNAGLIDIPQSYTEDSSTYILAKTSNIMDQLYPEFAFASLALYYNTWAPAGSKIVNETFAKELKLTDSVLDLITQQFIVQDGNEFAAGIPKTIIPTSMVNKMINQFGDLTSLRNAPLHTIDAFKIKNAAGGAYGLSDFMLLRNQAGVHAIAIDGYDYIKTAPSATEANLKYGDVIIYRDLLQKRGLTNLDGNSNVTINLSSELQTYFKGNSSSIMVDFLQSADTNISNITKEFFKNNFLEESPEAKNFYVALANYHANISSHDKEFAVQTKIRSTKETYSNRFGFEALDNGFAAPWIFNQNPITGLYFVTNIFKNAVPVYDGPDSYRKIYLQTITPYFTKLNLLPLSSTASSFKFSQYIYANNFYLNLSLKEFMTTNGSVFASRLKSEVVSKNASNYFQVEQNKNDFMKFKSTIGEGINLDVLNYEWINAYFASAGFDKLTGNKFIDWIKYNDTALANDYVLTTNNMQLYKEELFLSPFNKGLNNTYEMAYDAFLVASTVQYLLEDPDNDGINRFMDHLKNEITFGKDYYFVWTDNVNGKLDPTNKDLTTTQLLSPTQLKINSNNNYASKYFSNAGTLMTDGTSGENLYASSLYGVGNNHYDVMPIGLTPEAPNYLGYSGLQGASNNSLSNIVSRRLFNTAREGIEVAETSKGLLYQYGSLKGLEEHIDSIRFISDLEALAQDISNELSGGFDIDIIKESITIEEKKTAFKAELTKVNPAAFEKFSGVVSTNLIPDTTSSTFYAAYARQINFNDVNQNFTTFVAQQGANIVYNLLIKTAMDSTYKNIVLNQIVVENKFEVFDKNAKTALGTLWVKEDEDNK